MMKKIKWLIILCSLPFYQAQAADCVILLHGLAKTNHSMSKIAKALDRAGFFTVNYGYPSRTNSIDKLARTSIDDAIQSCPAETNIHFVTHSMGGILLRQYLKENTIQHLGRVVMLAPPNQGSQIVDKLKHFPGFEMINGPAGLQLGTEKQSIPNALGPAHFGVGIIAGSKTINPILSTMLPGLNDGKVTVENTKLEGMSDHIVMPVTHPFITKKNAVIKQVLFFLKYNRFEREQGSKSVKA